MRKIIGRKRRNKEKKKIGKSTNNGKEKRAKERRDYKKRIKNRKYNKSEC